MKHITSSHNETLKHLKQLMTNPKYRRREAQTVLEGIHLCQSYLEHGGRPLMCVYTDPAKENDEAARIIATCDDLSVPSVLVGANHFRALSGVENGVGLLFVIAVPSNETPARLEERALLLEDVQDPGNLGTILRTAAAAGVAKVYLSPGCASAWSPKVLRAGMGAHFALTIYERCDLAAVIVQSDVRVLATSLDATTTIYQEDLSSPAAWLFGNEGSGVSDILMKQGVRPVIIPQNSSVESLNVAASVAVCLFEQARQQQSVTTS